MRVQISAMCVVLMFAAALLAAQSSQRDTPSTTSTPTATTPTHDWDHANDNRGLHRDPRTGDEPDNATAW
jgi:hypothetical protein